MTLAQREKFERDGFLIVENLLSKNELDAMHNHYLDICQDPTKYTGKKVLTLVRDISVVDDSLDRSYLGPEYSYIKLNGFQGSQGEDEIFMSYTRHPKILEYVHQFVTRGRERELSTCAHMYVCKPPGLGDSGSKTSVHPLHQDLVYFPVGERDGSGSLVERDMPGVVCAWTAVGDVNRENGCLSFIPGSHWRGIRKHSYPNIPKRNVSYFGIQDLTPAELATNTYAEMKAGSVVFFHSQTIHGSGVNTRSASDTDPNAFRKAISVHYRTKGMPIVDLSRTPAGTSAVDLETAEDLTRLSKGRITPTEAQKLVQDRPTVMAMGRNRFQLFDVTVKD